MTKTIEAKAYVVVATPSLDHRVTVDFLRSALFTQSKCQLAGFVVGWAQICGDPFIAKARSKLVHDFLALPGATDLFFLDDDLEWPADKVVEFVNAPADIGVLCGIYPKKQTKRDWPVTLAACEETSELLGTPVDNQVYYRAQHVPTGFMRIKRWVLEQLYPLAPVFVETDAEGGKTEYRAIFNSGPGADGLWWGEDYAFSNACSAHGIDLWVDPDIDFKHRGGHTFTGRLADDLETFRRRAKESGNVGTPGIPQNDDAPERGARDDYKAQSGAA